MKADVLIEARFKTSSEGGRVKPINGSSYRCPMIIDGRGFECQIFLEGKVIQSGETYQFAVKFMNFDAVSSFIALDKIITLWEGKEIAAGKIIQILTKDFNANELELNYQKYIKVG
jgi:hypothetical protein